MANNQRYKATVTKVDKRLALHIRKQEGIICYDIDNNYPARVRDIVSSSGMGTACVNLYRKFIFGNGLRNVEFAKKVVNKKGQSVDRLHKEWSRDFARNGGFAIHFNYNGLFEKTEVNFLSFPTIRLTDKDSDHPDMFAIYHDWASKKIDKDKVFYVNKYNPDPEVIAEEVVKAGGWDKYRGQILYVSNADQDYPLAVYDSVLEDMQSDHQAKTYKYRNLTTNFMASHMIVTSKIESSESEIDRPGATTEKSEMVQAFEEFQGADEAMKLIHVEKESEEQTFEIKKIDQQNGDKLYEWTETSIRDNIRQSFLIPPVLLMSTPGKLGGTSTEIADATKYYNVVTEEERLIMEDHYRMAFEGFVDGSINPSNDYSILPRSTVERDSDGNRSVEIFNIVKDPSLLPVQKRAMLELIHEVEPKDALKLCPDVNQP